MSARPQVYFFLTVLSRSRARSLVISSPSRICHWVRPSSHYCLRRHRGTKSAFLWVWHTKCTNSPVFQTLLLRTLCLSRRPPLLPLRLLRLRLPYLRFARLCI